MDKRVDEIVEGATGIFIHPPVRSTRNAIISPVNFEYYFTLKYGDESIYISGRNKNLIDESKQALMEYFTSDKSSPLKRGRAVVGTHSREIYGPFEDFNSQRAASSCGNIVVGPGADHGRVGIGRRIVKSKSEDNFTAERNLVENKLKKGPFVAQKQTYSSGVLRYLGTSPFSKERPEEWEKVEDKYSQLCRKNK